LSTDSFNGSKTEYRQKIKEGDRAFEGEIDKCKLKVRP